MSHRVTRPDHHVLGVLVVGVLLLLVPASARANTFVVTKTADTNDGV